MLHHINLQQILWLDPVMDRQFVVNSGGCLKKKKKTWSLPVSQFVRELSALG